MGSISRYVNGENVLGGVAYKIYIQNLMLDIDPNIYIWIYV